MKTSDFLSRAKELENVVVGWRRRFHSYPELPFQETETSQYIAEELKKMGCENVTIGAQGHPVGVTADITGALPGKRVALRADIDALPVQEESGVDFASQNDGVMHACGHDCHAAMLLGAAKMLCEHKDEMKGSVRLLFQPSEEAAIPMQGADAFVRDGKLDGVDAVFGVHVWTPLESGKMGYAPGPMMACSDVWSVKIHGKGGHGASPHETHDPTVAAAQLITALQTFVSREIHPLDNAVISVGIMKAGGAFNVIPSDVELTGTARSFKPEISAQCEAFIKRMAENICAAYRCEAECVYTRNLPPTVNTPEYAEMGRAIGEEIFGAGNVEKVIPSMGGEDFSYYLKKVPGSFFYIGVGDEGSGCVWPHHHCRFKVDESQLYKGAAFDAAAAWAFLNS